MRKTKNLIFIGTLILLALVSCKKTKDEKVTQKEELATYANMETTNPCGVNPDWFKIDPTTGKRKTPAPAQDSTSVFGNNVTVSNCNFHQWSWQKFLWLTNDVSGEPLFMKNLIQVDNQNKPTAIPGSNKIILSALEKLQATGDILKSNSSFSKDNTSYAVYYSIHVDSTLYNTINKYSKMEKSKYVDATFPVGALELKVAWVDANAIKDTNSYFLTDAVIEGKNTQIALLGMHVVGIVYNHPEFIWATFEHEDLAPYYDWKATTTEDEPVTSTSNKLFFNKNTTGTIANLASHYGDPSKDSLDVFSVNKYGVPRQAQNAFLTTSQDGKESYNNIEIINSSIKSQLTDIWNNYFYNGSIWINTEGYEYPTEQAQLLDSLAGNLYKSEPGKLTRGSVAAYNITMETYEQLGFTPPAHIYQQSTAAMGNCFSCHSAQGSPLTISHVFNGAVLKTQGKSKEETKQKHLNDIVEFKKKMK